MQGRVTILQLRSDLRRNSKNRKFRKENKNDFIFQFKEELRFFNSGPESQKKFQEEKNPKKNENDENEDGVLRV